MSPPPSHSSSPPHRQITRNVVYQLPRNTTVGTVRALAAITEGGNCELEKNFVNRKLKMVTAYFGDLAQE